MVFGNTPKDNASTPLGSVYVPNTTGSDLTALEGTLINTDGNGQKSSAARMSLKDGDDVTQGTSTDANSVASVMGRLTKIRDLLNATLTVGGTITEANSAAILAALDMGQENMANSLSVVMASDQTTFPVTVNNANANGQTTMSASAPVVIASNQSVIPVKGEVAVGSAAPTNPVYIGVNGFGNTVKLLRTASVAGASATDSDLLLAVANYVYDGTAPGTGNSVLRTPVIFKTVTTAATGATAVWTPAAGKKFRLMKYRIEVTANAATAGGAAIEITLLDAAAAIGIGHSVFVPSAAVTTTMGSYSTGWIDMTNGYLSSTVNNVLNINLSAALTAGEVRIFACGTEE